jgi:hypothetical protein
VQQFRAGTGAPNTAPRVGPVVISEIMYHPPDLGTNDNERDEFIELHNITTAPVALFDVARPTNVWHLRDAVDFEFPTGTVIQPGDYLLVVSFDPVNNTAALEAFRKQYRVDPGVRLVGPYRGKLANSTDDIELRRPGAPDTNSAPGLLADTNSVPYLLVERVTYADTAPWPPLADGTGLSLQRVSGADFGNDPANWTVGTPTPGPMAAPLDYDGDHLLDAWEMAHGLDPLNPADAGYDSDGDGLTTYQEYLAGTDPFDPLSVLRFESVAPVVTSRSVVFTFTAVANVAYTIEYTDRLGLANWNHLAAVPAAPTNQAIRLESSLTTTSRFFRLRTAGP